jgi:hypothetical protein
MTLFKALGVVLALYTAYAAFRGEVYARARWSGGAVERAEEPRYFWVVIAIYFGLSVALLTVF